MAKALQVVVTPLVEQAIREEQKRLEKRGAFPSTSAAIRELILLGAAEREKDTAQP